jgi:hypothetical protein
MASDRNVASHAERAIPSAYVRAGEDAVTLELDAECCYVIAIVSTPTNDVI